MSKKKITKLEIGESELDLDSFVRYPSTSTHTVITTTVGYSTWTAIGDGWVDMRIMLVLHTI